MDVQKTLKNTKLVKKSFFPFSKHFQPHFKLFSLSQRKSLRIWNILHFLQESRQSCNYISSSLLATSIFQNYERKVNFLFRLQLSHCFHHAILNTFLPCLTHHFLGSPEWFMSKDWKNLSKQKNFIVFLFSQILVSCNIL